MNGQFKLIFLQILPLIVGSIGAIIGHPDAWIILLFSAGIGAIPSNEDIEKIVKKVMEEKK